MTAILSVIREVVGLSIASVFVWLTGAVAIRSIDHLAAPFTDKELGWIGSLKAAAGTVAAVWLLAIVVFIARWLA